MGRKANAKREPRAAAAPSHLIAPTPNWPLLAVSLVGVALTAYLAWTSWSGGSVQGCSEGSGCDLVLSSKWATLLGVPTAFWGLLTYLSLAGTAFIARTDQQWRLAWPVAFFGVLYSAYLTTISLTVLGAACPYCLTSLALMSAIFAQVTLQRPEPLPGFAPSTSRPVRRHQNRLPSARHSSCSRRWIPPFSRSRYAAPPSSHFRPGPESR